MSSTALTTPRPAWADWPFGLRVAWPILGCGAVSLLWVLARFWGANPEYADRLLIPFASGWLFVRGADRFRRLPVRPTPAGLVPLALGAAAFALAWYLFVQVGPKPVLLWWMTGAWVFAAAGLLLAHAGRFWLREAAFPLCFLLFALPPPNRVMVPLQHNLQEVTTSAAAAVLPLLGYPVERSGFVIHLAHGDMGVAEACSGVRSVTALTAIAAFVAHLRGFGLLRGAALLVLSLPVIAACNALRVVISGVLQEVIGPKAIEGTPHEALGVVMVLLGLGLIVLMSRQLAPAAAEPVQPGPTPPANPVRGATAVMVVMLLGLVGSVAAALAGVGTTQDVAEETAPLETIPRRIGAWQTPDADSPIDENVREMLTFDRALRRSYRDRNGYAIEVWVLFWTTRNAVKGYHHPDICFPSQGWKRADSDSRPVTLAGGGTLELSTRRFELNGQKQLVTYWTQEGRRFWTPEDERAVQLAGDSHRWIGDRLTFRGRYESTAKLTVLMGADLWHDSVEKKMTDFCRDFAAELYRVCPWAAPEPAAP